MHLRKAVYWSVFWIGLSLTFNAAIYYTSGYQKALEFLTGYLIEKSLSVDNLFVFLLIFSAFGVELKDQRHILNWGIVGVILLRGLLIIVGAALVHHFHWILYIFGFLLIYTGYHVVFGKEKKIDPEKNVTVRWFQKIMPVDHSYQGHRFFTRQGKKLSATPLFVCLLVIETTDVIFAIDSIPAIFAITTDTFIILTSNLMAVLGLRSLYFVLAELHTSFSYVKYGVGVVLAYIGVKMLIMDIHKIDTFFSLLVVLSILTISIVFSLLKKRNPSR